MARKKQPADPLNDLLVTANPETVIELVAHLAKFRPDIRRECFDYLKKHVSLTNEQQIRSESEIALALWWELHPDLEDLDTYGGGGTAGWEGRMPSAASERRFLLAPLSFNNSQNFANTIHKLGTGER